VTIDDSTFSEAGLDGALPELDRRLMPRLEARRARVAKRDAAKTKRMELEHFLASASWSELVAALGPR
jgi:hypothetical protein